MAIRTPTDEEIVSLQRQLGRLGSMGGAGGADGVWPAEKLRLCGEFGVYHWFVEPAYGGLGWKPLDVAEGYLKIAYSCLTTTFVITQRTGACKRIASGSNETLKQILLPELARGEVFATVGISHLTTSHRHQGTPALQWSPDGTGFRLNGFAPWVTGGAHADYLVVGAQDSCGVQTLFCVPANLSGITFPPPFDLIALNGSCTGQVHFHDVSVDKKWLLSGPSDNVLSSSSLTPEGGAGAGGLQTSVLALGLTRRVLDYLKDQTENREELRESYHSMSLSFDSLKERLFHTIEGALDCSKDELRSQANSLVMRATQAAMIAAKGAGFVKGHPVGRWCNEALFFLVWSCPQAVSQKNLCEFAGIAD